MNALGSKGAVAAGSEQTAAAGVAILENGGNAVDAAIAAAFAVSAGEPTVTSLGGAGMMMIRLGKTGETHVCDFFSDAPLKAPNEHENLDFYGVDLDYGPTTQTFYVGRGAAGVPGVIPGLGFAHEKFGKRPFAELLEPAIQFLDAGVTLGNQQLGMAAFLEPILTRRPDSKALFSPYGKYLATDGRFASPALTKSLKSMQRLGWKRYYHEILIPIMVEEFGWAQGGLLSVEDFERYRPVLRSPLSTQFFDHRVYTVPTPAAGGQMIADMLALLDGFSTSGSSVLERIAAFCAALEIGDERRLERITGQQSEDLNQAKQTFYRKIMALQGQVKLPGGPPSTTHISTIDSDGNAVALTLSHGESNACPIGDTGIMMNNFLGESDLLPQGFGTAPTGQRLATMMSPTIAVSEPRNALIAIGTGGANRIRSSILQVLWHLIADKQSALRAVAAPRLHYEGGELNIECFERNIDWDSLKQKTPGQITRFESPNLYFGGINCITFNDADGVSGAGDIRRGGVYRMA